uniref:Uncharacterized protein n=1 Tax=Myoviridae sp. ctBvM24 TaxID=2825050 RepID=A0A8S5UCW8_9CAUD|nr:MAG TPA: hypothetical protein [Myoviridae sp. ctBvM24]
MHMIFRAPWRKLIRRKGCASRADAANVQQELRRNLLNEDI